MYCILCDDLEKKTTKGVAKHIVKKHISHVDYKKCLFEQSRGLDSAQRIASHCHWLQTVAYSKVTLCPTDTERYLFEDGIYSLAYGHYLSK